MKHLTRRIFLLLLLTAFIGGIGCGMTKVEAYADDNRTILAFTSDVHNNEKNAGANRLQTWIANEQQAYGNEIDYMGFCGDMGRADSSAITEAKYWTYTQNVMKVADEEFPGKVCYTTGNHELEHGKYDTTTDPIKDRFSVDAAAPGAPPNCQIYCMGSRTYQPSWNNNVNEYTDAQVTALQSFLNACDASKPVFILSHYPLHLYSTRYTSNADKVIEVLNAAANQGKTIVFLWGHNHTKSDTAYDEIHKPNTTLTYAPNETITIRFTYAAAGCMSDTEYSDGSRSVKGKGLIVEVLDNKAMAFAYYDASGKNVTEGGLQLVTPSGPPYTVLFDTNGHGPAPVLKAADSEGKLTSPADPTAQCYSFGGWFKEASCQNEWNFTQDTVTANRTLYAKWTEKHDYGVWTKLNDTQHQRVCKNDPSHKEIQNHTWDNGSITTPATETTAGKRTFTCTACGATKTEVIEPTGGGSGGSDSGGGSSGGNSGGGGSGSGGSSSGGNSGGGGSSSGGGSGGGSASSDPEPESDPQAENQAAADVVIDTIAALPTEVSPEDEDAVNSAVAAYQMLTTEQKALVPDAVRQRLEQAETTIADWKTYYADAATARAVEAKGMKLKASKGKKLSISWKRTSLESSNTGYLVRYSTDKRFKKGVRTKTVKGSAKTKLTLKKLKKGKTYYVTVCAYTKVVNKVTDTEETICGSWTKAKKVKIKK
ncbi:MAG: InlB B-repeat-containing protein [Mogibacterium sp.]|nr:InlB B-repeat-containing protein [Mogibacterium sp.]